nr:LOW QUALITY PROTEIN: disintegrin and metalloproteinase domain-containing protein 30 [Loxodonta africana]
MGSSLYPDSSILLLALLAIRADPGCLGQSFNLHSEWGFDSYEIIIPRKVSPRMETQTGSGQVSYLLHLTGKNYILHLRPNRLLLPRHLRVFSFTDQGDFWEDHPYLPRDCNYLGFVEGSQESEATLSTCLGGLQGILKMEEQVYQIEPLRASSSFEHIFYLLKDEEFSPKACGLTDEETEWQISRQDSSELLESRDTYIHRKYLELLLVFDHKSCSIGLCCHQCRFRPSGYICRKVLNECDLAEYCDGNSSVCPADTYKQDGTPCRAGSLCYKKGCYIRYLQCQSIFGEGARDAPHQCYDAMNILGDRFGNCGLQGTGYLRCKSENALCGRLQCTNVKAIPNMPDHTTLISTHLQKDNLLCWGTEYHVSLLATGLPDLGVVRDGTSCGDNLVCVNRECVKITTLHFDCLPEKCNNRGICNNRKNCHCKYGWAPPFCEAEGFGGSIDSGPAGKMKERPVLYVIFIRLFLLMTSVITVLFRKMIGNLLRPI